MLWPDPQKQGYSEHFKKQHPCHRSLSAMDKGIRRAIFHLHYYKDLTSKFKKVSQPTFTYCQVSQRRFRSRARMTRKKLKNVSVGKLLDPSPLVYTIGISCNCSQKHPRRKKKKEGILAALLGLDKNLLALRSSGRNRNGSTNCKKPGFWGLVIPGRRRSHCRAEKVPWSAAGLH